MSDEGAGAGPGARGGRDLARLLAGLDPALDERPRVFVEVPAGREVEWAGRALGLVREAEGVTLVLDAAEAAAAGLPPGPAWARITLRVESDLQAVGLLAAVAARLAARGIAVNPFAGVHHDHLLVPWPRRHEALAELRALAAEGRGG